MNSKSAGKTIDELNKILELRSQNDVELHVEKVGIGLFLIKDISWSGFDIFKIELIGELKNAKRNDFEDMVYKMQLL